MGQHTVSIRAARAGWWYTAGSGTAWGRDAWGLQVASAARLLQWLGGSPTCIWSRSSRVREMRSCYRHTNTEHLMSGGIRKAGASLSRRTGVAQAGRSTAATAAI